MGLRAWVNKWKSQRRARHVENVEKIAHVEPQVAPELASPLVCSPGPYPQVFGAKHVFRDLRRYPSRPLNSQNLWKIPPTTMNHTNIKEIRGMQGKARL
jgi:hypothetical protein